MQIRSTAAPLTQVDKLDRYHSLSRRYLSLVAQTPGSVLLQTTRMDAENYRSYLFLRPRKILSGSPALFEEIEEALAGGAYVAGYLSYEFGAQFQGKSSYSSDASSIPAAWLAVYPEAFVFNHLTGEFEGAWPETSCFEVELSPQAWAITDLRLGITQKSYAEKITQIQEYIRSGDTYQANFTDKFHFNLAGSALSLFESLNQRQPTQYSAFLHGDTWQVLSHSPELFFRHQGQEIFTRPMKGTAPRGRDTEEDDRIAVWLKEDIKNRSENVMIVDLMRNDLGRICEFGSVRVKELFHVEKYETLFQMTSTVSGQLREGTNYHDIFASLFPCGSITGAPKLRTMDIIHELETSPRGVYTGAIGFISPKREAVFSVPIRTILLQGKRGEMGVGSGIVIDSRAEEEYAECLLKSAFLIHREEPFELFESMLWDGSFPFISLHLDRLERSARYFNFPFDRHSIREAMEDAAMQFSENTKVKVRAALNRLGSLTLTHHPVEESSAECRVSIASKQVSSRDRFLRHKTTNRSFYEEQYRSALSVGLAEMLFMNERDEVTEGSISNIFIEKDGLWFTPPVECGLLPGVYRRHLLETKREASERVLTLEDLRSADAIYICNAVRGCRKVSLA